MRGLARAARRREGDFFWSVFVYDTVTGLFGTDDLTPLNNNLSVTFGYGHEIRLIGGEAGGAEIEGVYYGHHPELFLKGRLEIVKCPEQPCR